MKLQLLFHYAKPAKPTQTSKNLVATVVMYARWPIWGKKIVGLLSIN